MQKKVLVLLANPKGTVNIELLPEINRLKEALRRSVNRERFAVEWEVAVRQSDLRRHILDVKPQIIHFCGHGTEQGLVLEDDTGNAKVVSNQFLTDLLRVFADLIECVLLNACDSENLADQLGQHLNYGIGMSQPVLDDAAIAFAEGFYDTLGAGESYEQAFEVGKNAVLGKATQCHAPVNGYRVITVRRQETMADASKTRYIRKAIPMKRLLITTFLPLLISQAVALAQADSGNPPGPENPPTSQSATVPRDQPQPPITPLKGTEQIQLRLVNCSWGLDCLLANVFLPASARLNQLELKFDNPASQPATILNSAVVVQGNLTQYPLPNQALSLPNQKLSLPAQQISGIPLNLDRTAMPPEQYAGAIYLTQANQSNRLVLPVNLSVRCGPLLPIVVLLLGVLLGRLFKYMQVQGGPQAQARKKVYQLEADIREAHPGDRKILLPMVAETRQLVYRNQLEAVDTQVTLIQSRRTVLKQLRAMEDQLYERQKRNQPITPEDLLEQLQSARDLIAQGQDDQAKAALDQILEAASARPRGAAAEDLEELESALRGASVNLSKSARRGVAEVETTTPLTWTEQLQQFLVSLAGVTDLVRAETTFWFVRPTLYLVLLTGLTLVGLNTLYIEKGETFGARPMPDYLVLLFWGLSADVASRSLSTLQGERE